MRHAETSDRAQDPGVEPGRDRTPRPLRRIAVVAATILAVAVIALIVVVAVNTARFPSKQVHPPVVPRIEPLEGYAERLARAIRHRTVAAQPPAQTDPKPFLE